MRPSLRPEGQAIAARSSRLVQAVGAADQQSPSRARRRHASGETVGECPRSKRLATLVAGDQPRPSGPRQQSGGLRFGRPGLFASTSTISTGPRPAPGPARSPGAHSRAPAAPRDARPAGRRTAGGRARAVSSQDAARAARAVRPTRSSRCCSRRAPRGGTGGRSRRRRRSAPSRTAPRRRPAPGHGRPS